MLSELLNKCIGLIIFKIKIFSEVRSFKNQSVGLIYCYYHNLHMIYLYDLEKFVRKICYRFYSIFLCNIKMTTV